MAATTPLEGAIPEARVCQRQLKLRSGALLSSSPPRTCNCTRYTITVAGVVLLTLLSSMLSVMQMQEAGRRIIHGGVIIVMLLVYGRGSKIQG